MRYLRAALCAPLGLAAMSVYAHALGGNDALNFQQAVMALMLVVIPSCLALTTGKGHDQ